jgi:phosphopantothenoylcysteine decarboxylase/phosphopantothenate--cysteine ligase
MNGINGKTILLGVSGGIAVYKAAALCSRLTQGGAEVHVIMTESAAKFVAPLTFQTLSRQPVMIDTFDERDASVVSHIDLADRADLVVVAPATANILAKMAHGLADDMLSTTLLAVTAPVFAAPAMNVHMYAHPAVQHNMERLRQRGVRFIEPGIGQLACGYVGKGRLAEPEEIAAAIERHFAGQGLLRGRRVLVTAGGTVERIDPVRYITNDSSGKMGYALAEAARDLGAQVTLVSGRADLPCPAGVTFVPAGSALDMMDRVMERLDESDLVIKAAAVADYRPAAPAEQKIKKKEERLTLELVRNPDILQAIGERKTHQFVIGFAAETGDLEANALEKLRRKRCDLLVANDVTRPGAGFGVDTNIVQIYDEGGLVEALPQLDKREVAERILRLAAGRMKPAGGDA